MSEKEKEIIRKVAQALPDMSDMNKGYFLALRRLWHRRKARKREKKMRTRRMNRTTYLGQSIRHTY